MLATTVGASGGRRSRRFMRSRVELDAVGFGVGGGGFEGGWLVVVAGDRVPAELGGGDREHAGAGAQVGRGAVGLAGCLELEQELQAEAGRRVGAGAEGLAGVDDDVDRALAGRLPGGAQPEALADQERLVEVAPAVGPVVGDLGRADLDPARARPPRRARPARAARPRRRRSRTRRSPGRAPPRPRSAPARSARRAPARRARAQQRTASRIKPKARRTRLNRPSPRRGPRFSGSSDSSRRSASSRCSSLRLVGTTTSKTTRWSPRRRPPSCGSPAPRRTSSGRAGCPAATSISFSPVERRRPRPRCPSIASVAGIETTLISSVPSRWKRSSAATATST